MSKKLQCQDCDQAEYGEDLYNYDGKILCRYCIVARVYEDSTPCEYVGICNDETFPNKTEQIDQLKQQNEELMLQLSKYETEEHKPAYCTLAGTECEYLGNVHELKQQLVEKDKEIEKLKITKNNAIECADLFKVALSVRQKDLAIQELEKVKELLITESKRYPIVYDITNDLVGGAIDKNKVFETLDNQIKELKGEKDVKD